MCWKMIEDRSYSIIMPKYDNSGRKIDVELHKKYAKEFFTGGEFKGISVIPVVLGCWYNKKKGTIQCEENIMLFSSRDYDNPEITNKEAQLKKDKAFVKQLARQVGVELGQENIMIEEDKVDVQFIEGEYKGKLPPQKLKARLFEKFI